MSFPGGPFETRTDNINNTNSDVAAFPGHRQRSAPQQQQFNENVTQDGEVDNLETTLRGLILKNQERDMDKTWRGDAVGMPPPGSAVWNNNNIPMGPGPQALPGFPGHPAGPPPNWGPNKSENQWPPPPPTLQGPPPGPFPPHHHHPPHGFPPPFPIDNFHHPHPPPQHPPPAPRFVGDLTDMNDFPPLGATPSPPPPPSQQQPRATSSPQNDAPPPTGPRRFGGSPRMHYASHKSYGSVSFNSMPVGAQQQHQRARSFNHPPRDGQQEMGGGYHHNNHGHGGHHQGHRQASYGHRSSRFQPGVKPPQKNFDIDYDKITSVALDEVAKVDVTQEEAARKKKALGLLEKVCEEVLLGSKLVQFGSNVSGLATAGADLDLIMEHDTAEPKLSSIESDVPVKLAEAFLKRGFKVALLTKTRVPILKLTSPSAAAKEMMACFELEEEDEVDHVKVENFDEEWPESMSCDIGFTSHLGIMNSQMLKSYTLCDPRFRQMVIFIKLWSKKRQINSPYLGTLSSYGYVLLVLHFLIQVVQPAVLPNLQRISPQEGIDKSELVSPEGYDVWFFNDREELERLARENQVTTNNMCLGQLLYEFFEYYAWHWDFSHDVVSIRSRSGVVTKEEKNWVAAVQRVGDIQNAYRDRYLFAIEDPFEISHNVARTCNQQGVTSIRNELKRALHFFKMCKLEKDGGSVSTTTTSSGSPVEPAPQDSWEKSLLCEVATPERVRNLSKEKRDRDEFVELLKMIKMGLKVGEREKVALPKPPRRGDSGSGSGSWHQNQNSFDRGNRFNQYENHQQQQQQHYYHQQQQQHYYNRNQQPQNERL